MQCKIKKQKIKTELSIFCRQGQQLIMTTLTTHRPPFWSPPTRQQQVTTIRPLLGRPLIKMSQFKKKNKQTKNRPKLRSKADISTAVYVNIFYLSYTAHK